MNEMAQLAFWRAVERCLTAFYHFSLPDAREKALELRKQIEELGPKTSKMIYHDQPLNVASDIAGQHDANIPHEWIESYRQILRECHW